MLERIDKLAEFGTSVVTISGGEPMMHPEIYEIIERIRHNGMIAGLISNGYYFQPEKVKRLNEAGLDYLQISIDNVTPDDVSKKSLKVLDAKLINLRDYAKFKVNINSVVGGVSANPEEALQIANRAREPGFSSTVGVIHDGDGLLKGLTPRLKRLQRDQIAGLAHTLAGIGFRTILLKAANTNGVVVRVPVISISTRPVSSVGALSNAAHRAFRFSSILMPTWTASTTPKNGVPRTSA